MANTDEILEIAQELASEPHAAKIAKIIEERGELTVKKLGINGNAPVAKAAAIGSPAAELAALKTAVDALREVVKKAGLTE